jgi:hypothetical protein
VATAEDDLVLRFGGSLVEQLGAQLYPSVTAAVAELISNAWDADAAHVWITMPFGDSWKEDGEIVVLDDGNGMTRTLAKETYLIVGRKRRLTTLGNYSETKSRLVHGRKGIGKLAAFGTAGVLDCSTLRDDQRTDFRLDYDAIRQLDPSKDYIVDNVPDAPPLLTPSGGTLSHGTRIRLTRLKMKRAISQDQFLRSMSRRFALNDGEMQIVINGAFELSRFDINCEFRFPQNGTPHDEVVIGDDGWAEEHLDGKLVRWWIGFTEKPLTEDQQQGISILANGKMAQRPFKFERSQGTEGQLGQEYLVGEVEANWLDEGVDIDDDLIQSNRDQLQLEDHRLIGFLNWGRRRLDWALRTRNALRKAKKLAEFEAGEEVQELLEPFTAVERRRLLGVAQAVSKIPEIDEAGIAATMRSVVDAQSDRAVREMMETIEAQDDAFQEQVWQLVHEFGLIDARKTLSIIEARLATIRKLQDAIKNGAREVPELHKIVLDDPWVLDPRWSILGDEVNIDDLGVEFTPELDEQGNRLDFLFALAPHSPARLDEVVVVEIKRGTDNHGRERKADVDEVNKFHIYCLAVQKHYAKSSENVIVRGLMIAQDYTQNADLVRSSLEKVQGVQLHFRTWDRIIDDTERMHIGWLNVSRDRIGLDERGRPR